MKRLILSTLVIFSFIATTYPAQAENRIGTKQILGTILGGALGGFVGSKVGKGKGKLAATAFGAIAGALGGNQAGRNLNKTDQWAAQQSTHSALESGRSGRRIGWQNERRGTYGYTTPSRSYQYHGFRCRDYEQVVVIEGRAEKVYGTACRDRRGQWQVTDSRNFTFQQPRYQDQYPRQHQEQVRPRRQQPRDRIQRRRVRTERWSYPQY